MFGLCARAPSLGDESEILRRIGWLSASNEGLIQTHDPTIAPPDEWGFGYPVGLANALDRYDSGSKRERARRDAVFLKRLGRKQISMWSASELKSSCRVGLPRVHRRKVWLHLLQVSRVYDSKALVNLSGVSVDYESLLNDRVDSKLARVIQADLRRTFPACKNFHDPITLKKLRNVLFAFAAYRPDVGYCQGLNFICGVFLQVLGGSEAAEEEVFGCLVQLICSENKNVGLHIKGYFELNMSQAISDLRALGILMQNTSPEAMTDLGTSDLTIFASEWLHALFATSFPFPVVLRIWDALISEGWKIIFRVSAATLRLITAPGAVTLSEEGLLTHHKRLTRTFIDQDVLMDEAFNRLGNLSRKQIEIWREQINRDQVTINRPIFSPVKEIPDISDKGSAVMGLGDISLEDLNSNGSAKIDSHNNS